MQACCGFRSSGTSATIKLGGSICSQSTSTRWCIFLAGLTQPTSSRASASATVRAQRSGPAMRTLALPSNSMPPPRPLLPPSCTQALAPTPPASCTASSRWLSALPCRPTLSSARLSQPRRRSPPPQSTQPAQHALQRPPTAAPSSGETGFSTAATRMATGFACQRLVSCGCRFCGSSTQRRLAAILVVTRPLPWPAAWYGGLASLRQWRSSSKPAPRASASRLITYRRQACSSRCRFRHAEAVASAWTSLNCPLPALATTFCRYTSIS
mmetsp:Transcript_41212/g.86036  ORF Transcript_41212/g.86036 Transcript_41212/m.86036 type:complete len:269 (-) Transcript_41212:290-1096(-)